MKKFLLAFIFLLTLPSFSQVEDAWFFLKDKPKSASFIENPLSMLSQRAIDRRKNQSINIDEIDVPIDKDYLESIKAVSGLTILGKSKWLNSIHIQATQTIIDDTFSNLTFIKRVEFADKSISDLSKKSTKIIISNHYNKFENSKTDFIYGETTNQIKMLKGDFLHKQGLTGEGQIIAVLDAGFPNVNTLAAFQRLRTNNQILGGYNFADRNTNFYTRHNHGTNVLSTIAGFIENEFVGTAPNAKFYLFITEVAETETVLEETLWVEAAERADSLGVDIINSSLGYTTFDNPNHSYSYSDMDGKTTFISRGAEIASSRGILVVNSAGNSGNSSWKYIGAPADAPSVISIGAVDNDGNIASFSSFGPTADGRIKPEIVGQGLYPATINHISGDITTASSGTSFSAPIIAGLVACLNQNQSFLLKPVELKRTNITSSVNYYLKKALYQSAHKYSNPADQFGYGIPNFEEAFYIYSSTFSVENSEFRDLKIFPNPIISTFRIENITTNFSGYTIQIFDILGKKCFEQKLPSENVDLSFLKSGIYLLKISNGNNYKTLKIIKE